MIDEKTIECKLQMMRNRNVDEVLIHSIALMFQSGCRVSSILGLSPADITANGRVILRQGKGSNPLILVPSFEPQWWLECRTSGFNPFFYLNYMRVYRTFKDYALTMADCFGSKNAVTASARKTAAQDVYEDTKDIEIARQTLGHKRTSSTEYYVKSEKMATTQKTTKKRTSNVKGKKA